MGVDKKARKFILFATILASGMAFLDGSVVGIAIPTIQGKFHASLASVEWVVNSYTLVLSALILLSGALGDRFGRKRVFVWGIGLFSLSSLLCGISQGVEQLILFRGLQGIGAAMMIPGSLSIINASFDESSRGKAIGVWSGYSAGVAALGPFLGGWLVQTLGWASIFYINLPLGALAFWLTWRFVPESRNIASTKLDIGGAVFILLGLFGISYGLMNGASVGWANPAILGSLLGGIVSLVIFVWVESVVKEPLLPLGIFRSPLVSGANLVTLFLYFALNGVIFFLVLNLQQVQHFAPVLAGLALLPTILLITFLSGRGGSWADRVGPRIPMTVGPLLVGTGMALLAVPGRDANYFVWYFPGLVLFGVGMSLVIAPLTKSALSVKQEYSGAASGVSNSVSRIAGLLAVALLGAVMLSVFSSGLRERIGRSRLSTVEREVILGQADKLGAVEIPGSWGSEDRLVAKKAVEESFVYGFRWAMGICSGLAFLSAGISAGMMGKKRG